MPAKVKYPVHKMCEKLNGSTPWFSVISIAMDFKLFESKKQTRILLKKFDVWVLIDSCVER